MDGIKSLQEAIATVPIPGAPPRLSMQAAAVGLSFLDTALRQNHVRRLTQRLTLIEHRSARCTTEVDVSLGLLDEGQREAGLYCQRLRNRDGGETGQKGDLLWVPVSRIPRRSQAPMDVVGAPGLRAPRLTQYETSWLFASALYRLLRNILTTEPEANWPPGTTRDHFFTQQPELRWLIQAALAALLTERRKPTSFWRDPSIVEGEGGLRKQALDVLRAHNDALQDYNRLLDLAVNEYLLVVGLDSRQDEHLLAFDTPLYLEKPRASRRLLWPSLRLVGGSYSVELRTHLPPSLRAYHLVAETEPSLQIRRIYAHSTADTELVTELGKDLTTLAELVKEPHEKQDTLIELELQTCLRRLAELFRRRRWEASQADLKLPGKALAATGELVLAGVSGDGGLLRHPAVTEQKLLKAAKEIDKQELRLDLSKEKGPHVYWRRDPSRTEVDHRIEVTSSIFLRDTSGSGLGSVVGYVASVVVISYVLGGIMFKTPFPYFIDSPPKLSLDADAIVAVLLLVPGFLYTRLNLPPRRSIAGQIRILPRFVAMFTVGAAAVLAATIAANADSRYVQWALIACAAIPPGVALLIFAVSKIVQRMPPKVPRWARRSWQIAIPVRSVPDSVFQTFE